MSLLLPDMLRDRVAGLLKPEDFMMVGGETFLRMKEITIADTGAYFVACSGHIIEIVSHGAKSPKADLAAGHSLHILTPDVFVKVTTR